MSSLSTRLIFSASADDSFVKLHLEMIAAVNELERNIIRKRQAEGVAKDKARGVHQNHTRKPVSVMLFVS